MRGLDPVLRRGPGAGSRPVWHRRCVPASPGLRAGGRVGPPGSNPEGLAPPPPLGRSRPPPGPVRPRRWARSPRPGAAPGPSPPRPAPGAPGASSGPLPSLGPSPRPAAWSARRAAGGRREAPPRVAQRGGSGGGGRAETSPRSWRRPGECGAAAAPAGAAAGARAGRGPGLPGPAATRSAGPAALSGRPWADAGPGQGLRPGGGGERAPGRRVRLSARTAWGRGPDARVSAGWTGRPARPGSWAPPGPQACWGCCPYSDITSLLLSRC